jgi:hypothetical protein
MRNLGNLDRLARLIIGAVAVAAWAAGRMPGAMGLVLGGVGALLLLTSLIRFCPLYRLVGLSTVRRG